MGRRDAVQVTIEVIARMRALDPRLRVTYEPGWETRGNGLSANYDYATVHHTATPTSLARPFPTQSMLRTGRSDLPGPLCNEAGPACTVDAPWIHVMAAHPANHAGASRASGPVPALSLFNPRTRGLEIDYAGTVPMLAGQLYVAHLWTRANADVLARGNVEHVRAHAETSITGKWDPGYAPGRTIDMGAFRRAAAAILEGAVLTDADKVWLRKNIGYEAYATMTSGPDKGKQVITGVQHRENYMRLQRVEVAVTGLTAAVAALSKLVAEGHDDLDAEQLMARIDRQIDESIKDTVITVDVGITGAPAGATAADGDLDAGGAWPAQD